MLCWMIMMVMMMMMWLRMMWLGGVVVTTWRRRWNLLYRLRGVDDARFGARVIAHDEHARRRVRVRRIASCLGEADVADGQVLVGLHELDGRGAVRVPERAHDDVFRLIYLAAGEGVSLAATRATRHSPRIQLQACSRILDGEAQKGRRGDGSPVLVSKAAHAGAAGVLLDM